MALVLRQSTAVDVLIGPFVDSTDGYTAETGVSPSVRLSKNGQNVVAKNDATTPVHDENGYYNCELNATDTNTVGTLVLFVAGSATHLPVRHEYQVIEEAAYDAMYATSADPVLDAAGIRSAVGLASADLDTQLGAIPDDVWNRNIVEPSSVPGTTAQADDALGFIVASIANPIDQTSSNFTLRNRGDSANIGSRSVTDDGTTFEKGALS
jgi:hypothetical protein